MIRQIGYRMAWFAAITFIVFFLFTGVQNANPSMEYPEESWHRPSSAESVGWSTSELEKAVEFTKRTGFTALAVVYDGKLLVDWGEVTDKKVVGSVRKSFLNALYGIHVKEGTIDLKRTLAELDIDDLDPLSSEEKEARIVDLLKSRSGVYHEAGSESPQMRAKRPARGSHPPNTFWYYNNWDFNALGTIFERETQTKIFEAFYQRIAIPLQMEHFQVEDGYYQLSRRRSIHPAYHFKMSVLDMARFGLLYLRNGQWKDQQLLSKDWIEESTTSYSSANPGVGYGYLWWIWTDKPFQSYGMYSATGSGGRHVIAILPALKLVIVHRAEKSIHFRCRNQLIESVIQASPDFDPGSIEAPQTTSIQYKRLDPQELRAELTGNTFYNQGFYNYMASDGKIYGKGNNQSDVGEWYVSEENGGEFCRKWSKWDNNALRCYPWSQHEDSFKLDFTWQCSHSFLKRVKGNPEEADR